MKQPKGLTRGQKEAATAYGLIADEWMFLKESDECMILIRKKNNETIKIEKRNG